VPVTLENVDRETGPEPTPTGQAAPSVDGARDPETTRPLRLPPGSAPPQGLPSPDTTPDSTGGPGLRRDSVPEDTTPLGIPPLGVAPLGARLPGTRPAGAGPSGNGSKSNGPGGSARPAPAGRGSTVALSADPRLLPWIRRAILALIAGVIVSVFVNWRLGVTAAALLAIIDTIYSARTMALIPAAARVTSAQRMTRRRLFFARPFGYMAVHARAIPGTDSVIDHLVVGPSGVIAIDSERWDRRLPVRTVASDSAAGPVLYHGPFSQKQRLAHARWEAAQAARLLSAELGREVPVAPAMVIYGPPVPWNVASLRGVDVLAGRSVGKYLRSRNRGSRGGQLGWDQTAEIFTAAEKALPPALAQVQVPRRLRRPRAGHQEPPTSL
jgi:hypothetical protein